MKFSNRIVQSVFVLIIATLSFKQAYAVGLGFSLGTGQEEWEDEPAFNGDRKVTNFGFVFDTAVARSKIFNYRLTFMKEENKSDGGAAVEINMDGWAMTHDFGFGIVRNENLRLWIGPELKIMSYDDVSGANNTNAPYDVVGFGFGPAIGLNLHLPQVVTFTLTAAYYMAGAYGGDYEDTYYDSFDVDSNGTYVTAGIIFRINE